MSENEQKIGKQTLRSQPDVPTTVAVTQIIMCNRNKCSSE